MARRCFHGLGDTTSVSLRLSRGLTKGGLVYPIIFSIVVDEVVRATLLEVYGPY